MIGGILINAPITFQYSEPVGSATMAVTRRYPRRRRSGSRYKIGSRPRSVRRRAGAFGLYRGTRGMGMLRAVARSSRLNPFPNQKIVRHKYVDVCTMPAAGAGATSAYQFRCNSVFDPDYTSVGHQPMFYDEMATQYKWYTVVRSKIKITLPPNDTQVKHFALWVDDDLNVGASPTTTMEQHKSYTELTSNRNGPFVLKASIDLPRWNKTSYRGLLADDANKIATGNNPGTSMSKYFTFWAATQDASAAAAFKFHVEIFYYVVWREPNDHLPS